MFKVKSITVLMIIFSISLVFSQDGNIAVDFNSSDFQIVQGEVTEYLGRTAFKGMGFISDVLFKNGIIEVDMAVTGGRSYPGINFRIQSQQDYEHFYIRPHRAGLYTDALQYTPCSHGVDSWQLFNGDGSTAVVSVPHNEWFHVRLEVKGSRARAYVNDVRQPSLNIYNLYHGESEGSLGLSGPVNNSAFFSNLSYRQTDELSFPDPPVADVPIGFIREWELSQPYGILDIEFDQTPAQQNLTDIDWQKVPADKNGLVNIAKYHGRLTRATDVVFGRTVLTAARDTLMEVNFGYSDAIMMFLNGQNIFFGNSGYTQRDPSFLGIIGLYDTVYLPLKKGENELLIAVAESMGGWGFMFQYGSSVYMDDSVSEAWQTEKVFTTSESVLWDSGRNVLYVTNFDQLNVGNPRVSQHISKVSLDGEILDVTWVEGLNNPLGMTIFEDRLYVAERNRVAEIDLSSGEIMRRLDVPGSIFLNDIAIDDAGNIYLSDSRKNVIWKLSDGMAEEWLSGPDVLDPNTMYMRGGELLFGNSGDSRLKSVDLKNKEITNIARFPQGFIDGIRIDHNDNLLVSLWKGKIYRVEKDGSITLLLQTENRGHYSADFEYIPSKRLLIVPTFYNNTVQAYRY